MTRADGVQPRFSRIVDEVEAELCGFDHASPYFTLRANFIDDLMRIKRLHRGGANLNPLPCQTDPR
jgi:hypothetical protein